MRKQYQKNRIGIALLSFAHFHQYEWVKAFSKDSRSFITGFWDDDHVRGENVEKELGIKFYKSIDELLKKSETDAAAICSEPYKHEELVEKCCCYNLPIMCEKPASINVESAKRIKYIIESAEVPYLQVSPQRLINSNETIKKFIETEVLGKITHVRKRHGHGFALESLSSDMPWLVDKNKAGGGAYMDEGIHEADLLNYFFGMPNSVCAVNQVENENEVEVSASALFTFPKNITVIHEAGWNWPAGGMTTEIYGEKGVLLQSLTDCSSNKGGGIFPHLMHYRKKNDSWEVIENSFDFSKVHHLFPQEFIAMIQEHKAPLVTIDDAIASLIIVEGVYKAIQQMRTYFY